ncbi:signal peptidase I [Clostridium chromiireducens]|jgi:signal peptidase I, bacterial type|uniref:Signal peptidase I n=1 Tax=Clostridium chromiireducens TaxID=225345 RepID=A0A964W219_9CLOT|nr:signal peptidase I [Clostridium chromiireducens]MVX63745.1 signal peptidase I [Clostridium chromiireducens]
MIFIKKFIKKYKIELFIGIILALILSKFLTSNLFYIAIVPSESMKDTLMVGDKLLVSKNIEPLKVGGIYTFYHENKLLIKRLIAVGGDHVKIDNNNVFVNGNKLDEPYVSSLMTKEIHVDLIVPEDKYYFLGDNRNNSNDARFWKNLFIDKDDIDGKAMKLIDWHNWKSLS